MTETEITPKWGADRKEIISCDARRAAAVAAIDGSQPLETTP